MRTYARILVAFCLLAGTRASSDVDPFAGRGNPATVRLSQETANRVEEIPVEVICRGDDRAWFRIGPFDRSHPVNFRFVRREQGPCTTRQR
jgi:hypothetical protein